MNSKFTKAVLCTAAALISMEAMAQDWTSGSETLYFEYDKSNNQTGVNTDRIREVLESCDVTAMSITGHADTDGNAQYNQGLSERRANRIKSQVVAMRILDADAIATRGAGESELAVLTDDNVREALNRRAEIVFSFAQPCGLYYTPPPADPVIYEPPVETVTYTEPAPVYTEPAPIYTDPAPVYTQPVAPAPAAPVVTAPPPVAAPPVPAAPIPPLAPVAAGNALNVGQVLLGAGALAALYVALDYNADGDDNNNAPVSP